MELDKYPQALTPSFFIVVVAAGGVGGANIDFYQSRVVAYTKKEATEAVIKQLQSENPELYERGQRLGGWRVTHIEGIGADKLEELFRERADQERQLDAQRVHMQQNSLLNQILRERDIHLLHQAIREGRISNYERLYLHDMLTKGEQKP